MIRAFHRKTGRKTFSGRRLLRRPEVTPLPPVATDRAGLYLHIPFCRSKCPYCDFYSRDDCSATEIAAYPDLLLQELALGGETPAAPLTSIFFGGGTPSLLAADSIDRILTAARSRFGFADDIEISLEANPGTVDAAYFEALRRAGVNRLSFGMQSTFDPELVRLGRIHRHDDAVSAINAARIAGFTNISLDLIYGRPGQGVSQLQEELARLLDLEPEHLSCYALTIEEETPFAGLEKAGTIALPEDDAVAEQFLAIDATLTAAGLSHYEISNYARPDCECRHNLGYWQRRPCLAFGAGAHAFLPHGWGERRAVPADLDLYRQRLQAGESVSETIEVCDRRLAMIETVYLGLRTRAGVDDAAFRARFGTSLRRAFPGAIRRCGRLLRKEAGVWRFDLHGWLLYDHLIANFL